jgi:cyclopropane fatty-acyl-phospholipid synthase-like methyltransferase
MNQARYDPVADFHVTGFDSADDPASQALLDLMGLVDGPRVLDIACGHGRISREPARRGAEAVRVRAGRMAR